MRSTIPFFHLPNSRRKILLTCMIACLPVAFGSPDPADADHGLKSGHGTEASTPVLEKVDEAAWPKYRRPADMNPMATTPERVWKVAGGHLISFNAGEWGGALYWLPEGNLLPKRLCDFAITAIQPFDQKTFLAVGGISHMEGRGCIYTLQRSSTEKSDWQAHKVLVCPGGPPEIGERRKGDPFLIEEDYLLVRLADKKTIGVTANGTVLLE